MGRGLRIARGARAPAPRRDVRLAGGRGSTRVAVTAWVGYLVAYDSAPAPGKVDTDTAFTATLEVSF
jgi:uncharacterized protein DUF481